MSQLVERNCGVGMMYRATKDIVIPAGTVLMRASDQKGGAGYVSAIVAHGKDFASELIVQVHPDAITSGYFEVVS